MTIYFISQEEALKTGEKMKGIHVANPKKLT